MHLLVMSRLCGKAVLCRSLGQPHSVRSVFLKARGTVRGIVIVLVDLPDSGEKTDTESAASHIVRAVFRRINQHVIGVFTLKAVHYAKGVLERAVAVGKAHGRLARKEHSLREGRDSAHLLLLEEIHSAAGKGLEHICKLHEEADSVRPISASLCAYTVLLEAVEESADSLKKSLLHFLVEKLGAHKHHSASDGASAYCSPVSATSLPPAVGLAGKEGVKYSSVYLNAYSVTDERIESLPEQGVCECEIEACLRGK